MVHNTRTENSKDDWSTPWYVFKLIEQEIGEFDLDAAASKSNHKCKDYFTKEDNSLKKDWKGRKVFLNPPYNMKVEFVKKAYKEGKKDNTIVVVLIPDATDTRLFYDYCMKAYKIYTVSGRIQFLINGERPFKIKEVDGKEKKIYNGNNLGSHLIVFKKHNRKYPKLRPFYHLEKDLKELACKYLDENNQCSHDDIDTLECRERMGRDCHEKKLRKRKSKWCGCGDEILIEGVLCETCKFMEAENNKNKIKTEIELPEAIEKFMEYKKITDAHKISPLEFEAFCQNQNYIVLKECIFRAECVLKHIRGDCKNCQEREPSKDHEGELCEDG